MSAYATLTVQPPSRKTLWLNRATIAVVILVLIAILSTIYIQHVMLQIRLALAVDQVEIFEQMRVQAAEKTPNEAVASLRYAAEYYPSGTKQTAGSKLDKIVESARASAIREIIVDLRHRTGQDHGDDPQTWIEALSALQAE